MPLGPRDFMLVIVLPALAAIAILAIARRAWAGAIAAGVAVAIAFPTVMGEFKVFPPANAVSWLFWIAVAAGLVGAIDAIVRLPWPLRALLVFLTSAAAAAVMLRFRMNPEASDHWSLPWAMMIFAAVGAIACVWWAVLDWIERDMTSPSLAPWSLFILAASIGLALPFNGELKQGELSAALSTCAAAAVILALLRRKPVFARGAAMAFSIILVLLVISVLNLADQPNPIDLGAILAAPIAIAIGRPLPLARLRPWARLSLRVLPLVLLMLAVVTLSAFEYWRAQKASEAGFEESSARAALLPYNG